MSLVGIIANPASGKDIRRVVARGVTVPDHEKINIVRRILIGIAALGIGEVRWMPDAADLVGRATDGLQLGGDVQPLDLPITDSPDDTTRAAAALRERGAACIVVLGGDGTCRAAAKGAGDVPLLPVSTGTNNAFPQFVEGTLAGLAAAVWARKQSANRPVCGFCAKARPSIWHWSMWSALRAWSARGQSGRWSECASLSASAMVRARSAFRQLPAISAWSRPQGILLWRCCSAQATAR
jgi:predicted polyphosphate/ATP-dependent NAD kinase